MMKLFLFFLLGFQVSWAQVSFNPSSVVWFWRPQVVSDMIMAPYDIIFDSTRGSVMPRMYRSPVFFKPSPHQKIDITGFNQLHISGSGQYSWLELKELISHIHKKHKVSRDKIYVLDFREEPHAFINDVAVSWFYGALDVQQNKSSSDVIDSELKRVDQVRAFPHVFINTVKKADDGMPISKKTALYPLKVVMREQEAVKSLGANYVRVPVTDHFRPEERDVDDFVKLVKGLPSDAWLHFKCRGGKGRTTTFMSLFDIIQNPGVAIDHILARQKAIGGTELTKATAKSGQEWKLPLAKYRLRLVQVFYEYRHAQDGWDKMKFSDWVRKHAKYLGDLGERYGPE